MSKNWLNLDQSPDELAGLYREDYYWYLRSEEFGRAFLSIVAEEAARDCERLLDVGCGEGQLSRYWPHEYVGFDGSAVAVANGRIANPLADLRVGRIEDPPDVGPCDAVVFGGILEVLVRPEHRVDLVNLYRDRYGARLFVVYDLERLDTAPLERTHRLLSVRHAVASGVDVPEVKLCRKILTFEYMP